MSYRKGHRYLSVFAGLARQAGALCHTRMRSQRPGVAFSGERWERNGHPHVLVYTAKGT